MTQCEAQTRSPGSLQGVLFVALCEDLEVHAAHAAAHTTTWHRRSSIILWRLGNHGLGGDQQTSNRGCILQGGADNLRRVDDASLKEIHELFRLGIEAEGVRRGV